MKSNIETILLNVTNTITSTINVKNFDKTNVPLKTDSHWNRVMVTFLNTLVSELYPKKPLFTFIIDNKKSRDYLRMVVNKNGHLDYPTLTSTINVLIARIEHIKNIFLTESTWQFTTGHESYCIPALPKMVQTLWIALYIKQINALQPIENGLTVSVNLPSVKLNGNISNHLRLHFGFQSILSEDEQATLHQLNKEYSSLAGNISMQLECSKKILNLTKNKETVCSIFYFYQIARMCLKLSCTEGKVNQEKVISTCMNLPLADIDDDTIIPLIIEELLKVPTLCPQIGIDAIFEKIMSHCLECIRQNRDTRVDIVRNILVNYLQLALQKSATSPNLPHEKLYSLLKIALNKLPPASPWRQKKITIALKNAEAGSDTVEKDKEEDELKMMQASLDINRRFGYGSKPFTVEDLCQLASAGEHNQLQLLIGTDSNNQNSPFNVDTCSGANLSLLQYAVAHNTTYDTIKTLLNHKADANREDDNGVTPLMWMIKCNHSQSNMELLLSHDAGVNHVNSHGTAWFITRPRCFAKYR